MELVRVDQLQCEHGVGGGVCPADVHLRTAVPVDRNLEQKTLYPGNESEGSNNAASSNSARRSVGKEVNTTDLSFANIVRGVMVFEGDDQRTSLLSEEQGASTGQERLPGREANAGVGIRHLCRSARVFPRPTENVRAVGCTLPIGRPSPKAGLCVQLSRNTMEPSYSCLMDAAMLRACNV